MSSKLVRIVAPVAVGLMLLGAAGPQASAAPARKLLWHLEFNGKAGVGPDRTVFNYDLGDGGGFGNSEQEYYTAARANSKTDGKGNFVITANRIPWSSTILDKCISCQFTSARINTANKLGFKYGRLEARMKVPAGLGTWPAFWMLGASLGKTTTWPASGEIDIVEAKGAEPTYAFGTVHGPGYSGGSGIGGIYNAPAPLSDDFHTYAIEWKPNLIDFYVDSNLFFSMTPQMASPNKYVYNNEFFLILNLAMGGTFAGDLDKDLQTADLAVDYIRYYSINGVGKLIKHKA
jgi:beta-glucanase (GH16 family)